MVSAVVSSQCQCVLFLPNLHPITKPTSSSVHCASSSGSTSVPSKQFLRGCYGLSQRSTLRSESGPLPIQNGWKIDCSSFSSSGHSLIRRGRGHCPGAKASQIRGGAFRALDASSCEDLLETSEEASVQKLQRRELVGAISSWIVLPGLINAGSASGAAAEDGEQSLQTVVPPAKTGLIERLLESSKANKAKYDQERLDAYYKRNFKDYFEFLKGTIENKNKDNLTEAEKGILNWLEKNK